MDKASELSDSLLLAYPFGIGFSQAIVAQEFTSYQLIESSTMDLIEVNLFELTLRDQLLPW